MLRRVALGSAVALILLAAILFTALNQQRFEVDVAFLRFQVSSGLALIVMFAAGLLAGAWWRSSTWGSGPVTRCWKSVSAPVSTHRCIRSTAT